MVWNNVIVEYHNGSAWQQLDQVTEVTCSVGRRKINDVWTPSSMIVTARYPSGFASPIAALKIDTWIRWRVDGNATAQWTGSIRDVAVNWGVLYSSNVGVDDTVTITCEGNLGIWGRTQGNGLAVGAGFCNGATNFVSSQLGLQWNGNITDEPIAATTVSGSALEWLNLMASTAQARVYDGINVSLTTGPNTFVERASAGLFANVSFSDTTNDVTRRTYDRLAFDSLSDNYYTEIIVTSDGLVDQVERVGSAPYRSFTVNTAAQTTTQMDDIALYVLSSLDQEVVSVSEISAFSEAQHTMNLHNFGTLTFAQLPALRTQIVFRGQTLYAQVEGATMTATPSGARFTYYLTPQEFYEYLILDNTVYGTLDNNKLGIY